MYVYELGIIDDFSFFTKFTPSNFNSISSCETFKDYDATLIEVTKNFLLILTGKAMAIFMLYLC